jgi:hypothetical protein
VKHSLGYGLCALFVAVLLIAPPASAAERAARAQRILPAHEIVTILHSAGFTPLTRPSLRGTNYALRALDEEGLEVRVVVDARLGEVISTTPVAYGSRQFDLGRPSVYDSGPPGPELGPPVYRATPRILIEEDPEPPVYRRSAPAVPAPVLIPPREREVVIVPPASAPDLRMVPPAAPPEIILPEGEGTELLPPPPPRFPQRLVSAPPTKPATKPKPKAAKPPTSKSSDAAKAKSAGPDNKQTAAPAAKVQ